MSKSSKQFRAPESSLNTRGISAIMPPSFFYGVLLPSASTREEIETALGVIQHLIWGVRAILAELKYKDGFLNSPNAYAFYRNEFLCLESYFQQLEAKSKQL